MKRILKFLAIAMGVLIVALVAAYALLPWKTWVSKEITTQLETQGMVVHSLKVENATLSHLDFSNVVVSYQGQWTIPTMRLYYSLSQLRDKRIDEVEIRDVVYRYRLAEDQGSSEKALTLPAPSLLQSLPFTRVSVSNSRIEVVEEDKVQATVPLQAILAPQADVPISVSAAGPASLDMNGVKGDVSGWSLAVMPQEEGWLLEASVEKSEIIIHPMKQKAAKGSGAISRDMLPSNLVLKDFSAPDVTISYRDGETRMTSQVAVSLSETKDRLMLKARKTHMNTAAMNLQAQSWGSEVAWSDAGQMVVSEVKVPKLTLEMKAKEGKSAAQKVSLPMPELFQSLPIQAVQVEELQCDYPLENGKASVTAAVDITLGAKPKALLRAQTSTLSLDDKEYVAKDWEMALQAASDAWILNGSVPDISAKSKKDQEKAKAWLPLSATLKGQVTAHNVVMDIQMRHADFLLTSELALDGVQTWLKNTKLQVAGGTLTSDDIALHEKEKRAKIAVDAVSLQEFLQLVLKDDDSVQATGNISGTIPISYGENGLNIAKGELHSTTNGTVSIGAKHLGALPDNVEQVKNVTELLKAFHYNNLMISTEKNENNLVLTIALQGNNPNVYEGAPVNLNINLRGDVLEAISSALGIYALPEQYLKGISNDK